ncbi:TonB-dependent receptor [Aliarcobacter lanthieri]|uniref:TonB-dependent receptor n=1 Tax=Aliarcobacter lanthieri TaxID=1355374 RepID=UPI000479C73A|nr:TonB-dependent siderophore receptor [Aliarcobacter lanthieri]QKF60000.1 TonB-dependent receptor [Aliarcobacter lanthieri]
MKIKMALSVATMITMGNLLSANETTVLEEIKVNETKASSQTLQNGQISRQNSLGILGSKDFMDIPFNTVSYTSEYIEDEQAKYLSDVIAKTDPSIYNPGRIGAIGDGYSIRGFSNNTQDVLVNGLYGMTPYYRMSPEFIEKVDVLKGPSALLNGMSPGGSVGGAVSIITKKAKDTPTRSITATYDSDSLWGTHLDLGQRFGEKNQFGVRFNGAYRKGDTAVDNQEAESRIAHLAFDYKVDRGQVSVEYLYSYDHIDGLNRGIGVAPGLAIPTPPKNTTLFAPKDTFTTTEDHIFMLTGDYDITDNIFVYGKYGHSKTDFDALASSTYQVFNTQGDYRNDFAHQRNKQDKDSADIGIRFSFDTFGIKHELTTNATYYHHNNKFGFKQNMLGNNPWITNIYKPNWNGLHLDKSYSNASLPKTAEVELSSYGFADSISMFDDKLNIILGLREQNVVQESFNATTGQRTSKYDESKLTPAVAVSYKFTDSIMAYANYIEGLSQGPTAPATVQNAGEMFAPYQTKQYETGIKMDFEHFTNTLSIFQIEKPSGITDLVTNIYSVDGEQRNRGIEYSFFGDIFTDLRFMGGVSYIEAKNTKTQGGVNEGKYATATPKYQGKLGLEYDITNNLSVNANASAMSKQYVNADNSLWVSGRTIYDIGAKYKTKIGSFPTTFRADIHNVMDKDYWAGGLASGLGAPRTVMLSATLKF